MGLINNDEFNRKEQEEKAFSFIEFIEGYKTNNLQEILDNIIQINTWFRNIDESYNNIQELQITSNKLASFLTELAFFESVFKEQYNILKFKYDNAHNDIKTEQIEKKMSGIKASAIADQQTKDAKKKRNDADASLYGVNAIRYQGNNVLNRMNQHISILKNQ